MMIVIILLGDFALHFFCIGLRSLETFIRKSAVPAHVNEKWPLLLRFLLRRAIKLDILDDNLMSFNFRNEMSILF